MKYLTLIILSIIVSLSVSAQTNFSGTWKRNTEQCDPGKLSINSIPTELTVSQTKTEISIKRTSVNKAGDSNTYTEKLKFDGTASETTVKTSLKKKGSLKWSDDKTTLSETADYTDDQNSPVSKITETWTLSGDGKTLTINRKDEGEDGTFDLKEVFEKQ